jgi:quercetin dioxygenase-like cupin family protein
MRTLAIKAGTAALAAAVVIAIAQPQSGGSGVIHVSAYDATFEEGLVMVLWGNRANGPYGAFTRMEPGAEFAMHSHTNEVRVVVIEGAYLYRDEDGEKRVGPGEFLRIPGGHVHWSGGDANDGALFYEESSGRFDIVPASEPARPAAAAGMRSARHLH